MVYFYFQADICSINDALAFLVALLRHKSPAIVENGGGILRNISSFIATSPDGDKYRYVINYTTREILQLEIKVPYQKWFQIFFLNFL